MKQQKAQVRTLAIGFDKGTEETDSAGTKTAPEFGSSGTAITRITVSVAILEIILIGGKRRYWN